MTHSTDALKTTPLTPRHQALGARMTPFAGYQMPVVYTTIQEEHLAIRKSVGVFDVSHMGEFIVRGKEALDLIQLVTSNDVARLEIGDAQYSCLPNHHGGIVDDLLVYRLSEEMCAEGEMAFMLVVNASNIQKDLDWINQHNTFDARVIDISDQTGLIAVQGPRATELLQPLTNTDLNSIPFYKFQRGAFAGKENVIISATGYTGAGGFELYANAEDMPQIWDAIFNLDTDFEVVPAGLGARDTLRLEMGYCLYGNDIDDSTSPIEAGLGWITKTRKGKFNSVEIFREQREQGIDRKLVGFTIEDRRVPRHNYPIEDLEGNPIGRVTSGTLSPCLQIPIGMGYVTKDFAAEGTKIVIRANRKELAGTVVKVPFYKGEK